MTVNAIIDGIQDLISTVSGIRSAPDEVPEKPISGVMSVAYPDTGEFDIGDPAGQMKGLHNIVVEIIIPRTPVLRTVLEKLYPFGTSVPLVLASDTTFGGTADTFSNITYKFGPSPMFGEQYLGWIFRINGVKAHDSY